MNPSSSAEFQLRFASLSGSGRSFVFSCDAEGRVDLDRLSEEARNDYFYARAMVGREVATPAIAQRKPRCGGVGQPALPQRSLR
jgi:hypothetical protein